MPLFSSPVREKSEHPAERLSFLDFTLFLVNNILEIKKCPEFWKDAPIALSSRNSTGEDSTDRLGHPDWLPLSGCRI
jgi:hypothetical protein